MGVNRGKDFEDCIREACESIPDTSVTRLLDPQAGYAGVRNICDFIVYKYPTQYFLECKSIKGNTLNFKSDITKNQWDGMLEKSAIHGVVAGVIVWFIDHDKTIFVPIQDLEEMRIAGHKSFNVTSEYSTYYYHLEGKKKRIYFEYDMKNFFEEIH
jgi:penicillin-binding protein-related factor A (putative recombinase)